MYVYLSQQQSSSPAKFTELTVKERLSYCKQARARLEEQRTLGRHEHVVGGGGAVL